MADCGNITIVPSEVVRTSARLPRCGDEGGGAGAFPVVIGGDHAITFPVVRGLGELGPVNIVHFDRTWTTATTSRACTLTHAQPDTALAGNCLSSTI